MSRLNYDGPVVLVIMDGVGLRKDLTGNAVALAHTEFLDKAMAEYPSMALLASGEAVGITPDTMGNSEVGHNTIGCGQIAKQGIARIDEAFETGEVFQSEAWTGAIAEVLKNKSTLHFSGIFSDGKVHSSIEHLMKMIEQAAAEGVRKMRVHAVLDGRDVPPQSEPKYINMLESFVASLAGKYADLDVKIASGGGRMVFVADRYENDWGVVERGFNAICHGEAEHKFTSAAKATESFRAEDPRVQDQYMPAFVVVDENGEPVGKVSDGDAFIYTDFRADRAIEIAQAFTYEEFPHFDRGYDGRRPEVFFAGMTEYNSDTHVPEHQLVPPVAIKHTLNEFVADCGLTQLAVSETVKFGHITYYFNGNSYAKAAGEEQIEVQSDTQPFETRPWMKAAETCDVLLERMADFDFVRVNFAGGDMVGHTGGMEETIAAMEAIDIQLSRLAKKVDELGGMMIITADHGNAEELMADDGSVKTSHTTNLVPCVFYDNTASRDDYVLKPLPDAGLSNIAATIAVLLGHEDYPEEWRGALISSL